MGCLDVVNDKNLKKFNDEHTKGVWLVWFYADWCGHCRQMAQSWGDFANNNNSGVNLAKVREEYVPRVSSKPNIQGWPTIMLYKNGMPVDTYQGERTPEAFNQYVSNNSDMSENNSQDVDREVMNANNVIRLAKPKTQKKKKSVKKAASNTNSKSKSKKQTRKRKRASNSNSNSYSQKPKRKRSRRSSKKN